jgi:hypothetical protein
MLINFFLKMCIKILRSRESLSRPKRREVACLLRLCVAALAEQGRQAGGEFMGKKFKIRSSSFRIYLLIIRDYHILK